MLNLPAIIIEGMDCSGKSTLALKIAEQTWRQIQESEGPPRPGENINDRIRRYSEMQLHTMVYVRHPAISQPIYSGLAGNVQTVDPDVLAQFYADVAANKYILIYCDPAERGLEGHVIKEHDSPEHIAAVEDKYNALVGAYRQWAGRHAHLVWRIGDDADAFHASLRARLVSFALKE